MSAALLAKSRLGQWAKIFAVITALAGMYAIPHYLVPAFSLPLDDYIIYGTSTDGFGPEIDFHLPEENLTQQVMAATSIYTVAKPGDHLQMDRMRAYRQVVRNGHVLARTCSGEQWNSAIFVMAAFFPLLLFIPSKVGPFENGVLVLALLAELAVLGLVFFRAGLLLLLYLSLASGAHI